MRGKIITITSVILAVVAIIIINTETSFFAAKSTNGHYPVNKENGQKIVQEVAKAYYLKGTNIEYGTLRRNEEIAPEQITDQNVSYTVCSGFTAMVYKEALGIEIPMATRHLTQYAKEYSVAGNAQDGYAPGEYVGNSTHKDVVYYTDIFRNLRDSNAQNYATKILGLVEPGDVITTSGKYNSDVDTSGHAMLIYKIIYDNNGNRVNAIILNSNGCAEQVNNNIRRGLTYTSKLPDVNDDEFNGFTEGSINTSYLIKEDKLNSDLIKISKKYFSILRPTAMLNEGKYNTGWCRSTTCEHSKTKDYEGFPATSLKRIKYPGIQIEKTVDVFNGSIVETGQEMTYNIEITNNSGDGYSNVEVKENIPAELVTVSDLGGGTKSGNTISWNVNVNSGATKIITYKVRVNNDNINIGKEIESTGSVAGIPSATVRNKIYKNLADDKKALVRGLYDKNKVNYTGIELINKIYEAIDPTFVAELADGESLLSLESKLGQNFSDAVPCEGQKGDRTKNYLIVLNNNTFGSGYPNHPKLNDKNVFSDKVYNHYYSAIYDCYVEVNGNSISNASQIDWAYNYYVDNNGNEVDYPFSDRAVRVYPETLQTGDILLYSNTNDTRKVSKEKQCGEGTSDGDEEEDSDDGEAHSDLTYWDKRGLEHGFYAFIYIEDGSKGAGFYGGSYDMNNYSILNNADGSYYVVNGVGTRRVDDYFIDITNDASVDNLSTLYSKDYYAILRPSMKEYRSLSFENAKIDKKANEEKFINVLTGVMDGDNIVYTSSNSNVATVNPATGEVTIKSVGEAVIIAKLAEGFDNYESEARFELKVTKVDDTPGGGDDEPGGGDDEPGGGDTPGGDDVPGGDDNDTPSGDDTDSDSDDSDKVPNTGVMQKGGLGSDNNFAVLAIAGTMMSGIYFLYRKIVNRRKIDF